MSLLSKEIYVKKLFSLYYTINNTCNKPPVKGLNCSLFTHKDRMYYFPDILTFSLSWGTHQRTVFLPSNTTIINPTNQPTNEENPSEADSCSIGQEIPHNLRNPHNIQQLDPPPCQMHLGHTFAPKFPNIHKVSQAVFPIQVSSVKFYMHF